MSWALCSLLGLEISSTSAHLAQNLAYSRSYMLMNMLSELMNTSAYALYMEIICCFCLYHSLVNPHTLETKQAFNKSRWMSVFINKHWLQNLRKHWKQPQIFTNPSNFVNNAYHPISSEIKFMKYETIFQKIIDNITQQSYE